MKLKDLDAREVLARMAYSRQQFKNRVEEKVGGALLEFYKAECAAANGLTKWVQHWRAESRRLLGELQIVLIHEIRGFKDRRKALEEVLQYLDGKDASYRRIAQAAVARDFELKKLKFGVPGASTGAFHKQVEAAAEVLETEIDRHKREGNTVVRIRMKKLGRKHRSFFRIVAIDGRQPRDGRVIEELGSYDPQVKDTDSRVILKPDRIKYWISVGAQPSDQCKVLFKKYMKKFEQPA